MPRQARELGNSRFADGVMPGERFTRPSPFRVAVDDSVGVSPTVRSGCGFRLQRAWWLVLVVVCVLDYGCPLSLRLWPPSLLLSFCCCSVRENALSDDVGFIHIVDL